MNTKIASMLPKNENLKYFLSYTAIFIFTSTIVFSWFYLNDRTFIIHTDGIVQHHLALVYWGQYLRRIVYDLFEYGRLIIPMFDFSIGYGSDILTTLHYSVIGDPLNFLTAIVPTHRTETLYEVLVLLRLYLSGVAFSLYCIHMKRPKFAVLCGALIYVFCGYALFASVRHPYFINSMIYFPLLVLGIEKIFSKQKPYLFIVMVFISAVSNFYFFYKLSVLILIYAAIRFFALYRVNIAKNLAVQFGRFSFYYIVGLLMAGVVFLPVIMAATSLTRAGIEHSVSLFYPLSHYEVFFSNFVMTTMFSSWMVLGYSSVALVAVVLLFTKKNALQLKVAFVLLTAFLLLPIMGFVMNAFTFTQNRWVWGYSFVIALISVVMIPGILNPTKKQITIVTIFSVLYFLQGLIISRARTEQFFVVNVITFLVIILMLFSLKANDNVLNECSKKCLKIYAPKVAMISLIVFGIVIQAFYLYSPNKGNYVGQFTRPGEAITMQTDNASAVIKSIHDDAFFRHETFGIGGINTSILNRQMGTDFYFSMSNPHIFRFLSEDMWHPTVNVNFDWHYAGLDTRAIPGALASVKYLAMPSWDWAEMFVPYGYSDAIFINDRFVVFENKYALPLGYTYSSVISENAFNDMTPIERQQAMIQGVIINEDIVDGINNSGMRMISPTFVHQSIAFELVLGDGMEYDNGSVIVSEANATMTLQFEGIRNSELYLSIPQGTLSRANLTVSAEFRTRNINYHAGRHGALINLFYTQHSRNEIEITFRSTGRFLIDGLEVIALPMDNFGRDIDKLREVSLENIIMGNNYITGTIASYEDRFLLMAIPYNGGWRAYIDGERTDVFRANTMFMGIFLSYGSHEITFRYTTPFLVQGAVLSIMGIIIFAIIIKRNVINQKKEKIHIL